mgnify:CR=1 FL=1
MGVPVSAQAPIEERAAESPYVKEAYVEYRVPKIVRTISSRPINPKLDQVTIDRVLAMVTQAGFNSQTAYKVILCESGWNPQAKHYNPNGTWDIGLWQINDVHGMTWEQRMDPIMATQAAINLLRSPRSWNHWVCYR